MRRSNIYNKVSIFIGALLGLVACQGSGVKISGRIIGADHPVLYLEEMQGLRSVVIDSVAIDKDGRFSLKLEGVDDDPKLYNIVCDWQRVPLFLSRGENLTISAVGNIAGSYIVEGSEESELLREFYQAYIKGAQRLDSLANKHAAPCADEGIRTGIAKEYTKVYQGIKREQLKFIIENQTKLASVYALFQRLPGDIDLFNGDSDIIYMRTVAESIAKSYPNSSYLKMLNSEIERFEAAIDIKSRISTASYPDLDMPDMFGKKIKLSSLLGKVTLLDFWSAELGTSNANNAELKELYKEFSDHDFEIYQVGVDNSKTRWISAVQDQRLPWISVSDLLGGGSPAVGLYNIQKLPSNFLIDQSGEIVATNLWGDALKLKIKQLTSK